MIELRWLDDELQMRQSIGIDASGALCPGESGKWETVPRTRSLDSWRRSVTGASREAGASVDQEPIREALLDSIKQLEQMAIRPHFQCEDEWYTCPAVTGEAGEQARCRHDSDECECGADSHNQQVRLLAESVMKLARKLTGHRGGNMKAEALTSLNLDVSGEHARALHRVVRAMHDGHCPKCGHLGPAEHFWVDEKSHPSCAEDEGRHECPACHFVVTETEARAALMAFHPYLNKSVEVFERWRQG